MKILITGANGQLARSTAELYRNDTVFLLTKDIVDIRDTKAVSKVFEEFQPEIVFHFASLTRGDACAENPELAYAVNVNGTRNVVESCHEVGARLVFVSTNEVFDGTKKRPYREKDLPNPITVVGNTKLEAERIIRKKLKKYFIIRTSWLYSNWSSNFIHVVFNKVKNNETLTLVEDEISSPTNSFDLAEAINKLIKTEKFGTYHLVNQGIVSRLEFAKKALEIVGAKDFTITSVKLKDFKRLSKPPLYSPLENVKAKKLGIEMPSWEDALKRFLKTYDLY